MGIVEKKLISAEKSRKALLKRQGLNWALKYMQNFHMWYCDVAWKCHPKRESHKKVIDLEKSTFWVSGIGFQLVVWFIWKGRHRMRSNGLWG